MLLGSWAYPRISELEWHAGESLTKRRSERILTLIAMGVDPDDVREVVEALRARSAPAAVSHSTHRRVDLVVDRGGVHIDNPRENLRRHFEGLVGVACQDRGGQSIHRPVGRFNSFFGGIDNLDDNYGAKRLFVRDRGIEWDVCENRRL